MKMLIIFVVIVGIIYFLKIAGTGSTETFVKGTTIGIDVRTSQEYAENGSSESLNMPVDQIETLIATSNIKKTDPIFVFCRSGARSSRAKSILQGMGYTQVINIGTYKDWARLVEKP